MKFWVDNGVAACAVCTAYTAVGCVCCVERSGDREECFGEGIVECPWLGEVRWESDRGCVFWVTLLKPVKQAYLGCSVVSLVRIRDSERLSENVFERP